MRVATVTGGAPDPAPTVSRTTAPLPLWPWGLLGFVTLPLTVAGILVYSHLYTPLLFGDADWYAMAVPALTSDAPLYDPSKLEPHPLQRPVFWDQAPSTALFASVLILPAGKLVWGLLMAAAVVAGLVLIWPRVGLGGTVLLAPVVLLWFPVVSAIVWANINSLVFLLLAVAWRWPQAAGWAIGIAAAAKLVPILGVAWLVGKRDYRGAVIGVAIPIVMTAIIVAWKGPDTLLDFVSLRANQWNPDGSLRWGVSSLVAEEVALILGLAVAAAAWWRASFALAVVAMLVSIPVMHGHYWTWALVPLLGGWSQWTTQRRS